MRVILGKNNTSFTHLLTASVSESSTMIGLFYSFLSELINYSIIKMTLLLQITIL
jgi:hypothetical protein